MNQEQNKKELDRIYREYEEARKKYEDYVKEHLSKEVLDEAKKLQEDVYKKSKELFDIAYSIACPKS